MAPDACQGTPTPAPATILYTPTVPQPEATGDIVGVIIQNTEATAIAKRIFSFGQVFASGQAHVNDTLVAKINGAATPVQMDALATWPNGSVKLASLSLQLPSLCPRSEIPVMVAKSTTDSTPPPLNISAIRPSLTVTLRFTAGSYSGTRTIDLGTALQTTLGNNPDYWLSGPLVTQARVDVPLTNGQSVSTATLHLTADVSVFSDDSMLADIQFNNDLTTVIPKGGSVNPQSPLPALEYSVTIDFQGKQVTHTVSQVQYTNWHATVWTHAPPSINVQHDIAQLQRAGVILPYDLATGVNNSLLKGYETNIIETPGFGQPLSINGVTTYMPGTGGRPDIGFTTQYNTVWLLTQDARAAKVSLAQSDTSGAIPWNYKLTNGNWLTPSDFPNVWIDERGGPHGYTDGIANVANTSVWMPDNSHQPNLNYIPYLMTGSRWSLDRLNAQAGFNLLKAWPGTRCITPKCNTLLVLDEQVRAQAWALRELAQAGFIGRNGSFAQAYFSQTVADNWAYLQTQQPLIATKQGEAAGWMPGAFYPTGATAGWQQDFLTGIAVMIALMGDDRARQFVGWQRPWLSGRFVGNGMNPYDGCNYNLVVKNPTTGIYLNTWSAIESATVAASLSTGTDWLHGGGTYCDLARSALSGALTLYPDDPDLQKALSWLQRSAPPSLAQASFQNNPTFNVGKQN
jgi:hypothetical protein